MNTLVERAQLHADEARNRVESNIARQWWAITQPTGEKFELWVPDGITHADVLKRYPHAGVLPL